MSKSTKRQRKQPHRNASQSVVKTQKEVESTSLLYGMQELFSALAPFSLFDIRADLVRYTAQYRHELGHLRSQNEQPIQKFVSFFIPLNSYLALPPEWPAIIGHHTGKSLAVITFARSFLTNVSVNDHQASVETSMLVVMVGNPHTSGSLNAMEYGVLNPLYDIALTQANYVLSAYKLCPGRHNHDLQALTVMNLPSYISMVQSDATDGRLLEGRHALMHTGFLERAASAKPMPIDGVKFFTRNLIELVGDRERPLPKIVMTILEAIDQDCLGHHRRALVLADTYVEHMMRYLVYRLVAFGVDEATAARRLKSCSNLDQLLAVVADQLGSPTPKELASKIGFEVWRAACRKPRNLLTHDFNGVEVSIDTCREALRQTITMTACLAELVAGAFKDLSHEMSFFVMVKGYLPKLPKEEDLP